MRALVLLAFPLLAACGSMEQEPFSLQLDPGDASVLRVDTNQGDVTIGGTTGEQVHVVGLSVGRGINDTRAQEALEDNRWGGGVDDGVVRVFGQASSRGSVDLEIDAPYQLSADVIAGGVVTLHDMDGNHVVTADRVVARGLSGNADLYARDRGLDVEIWPKSSADVRLQSHGGDVVVYLPYGADYDLAIFGDPAYELTVDDLGFDRTHLGVGTFSAERGSREVEVTIHVEGGSVEVREALAR